MADNSKIGGYTVRFGLNEYFQKTLMPLNISALMRIVNRPTPHTLNKRNLLILVNSGSGRMDVNGTIIPLQRGTLVALGPFHNYSILPDNGKVLELSECVFDSSAHMYVECCPYVKVTEFVIPSPAAVAQLNKAETRRAEHLYEDLMDENGADYYGEKMRFLYMMELTGILRSRIGREYMHNSFNTKELD